MKKIALLLVMVLFASVLTACGRRAAPPPSSPPIAPPAAPAAPDASAAAREAEERARLAAEEAARRAELARRREALAATIYFDYDSWSIREDSRRLLDEKAAILQSDPTIRVRIAGHTDERGSTEYNIALGARRAQAVVDYLARVGVAVNRFDTISYGEELPIAPGETEAAWARNRRAEFEVVQGLSGS